MAGIDIVSDYQSIRNTDKSREKKENISMDMNAIEIVPKK